MPEATTHAEATADTSAVSTTEAITSAQQETLHNIGSAGAAMLEGLTKAQTEIADFITERIRQDVETQAEMLHCRTLDDVRDLQNPLLQDRCGPVRRGGEPAHEDRRAHDAAILCDPLSLEARSAGRTLDPRAAAAALRLNWTRCSLQPGVNRALAWS